MSKKIIENLRLEEGSFFALLDPSADFNRIEQFESGGILASNRLETVVFQENLYPARKKKDSVDQLALFLKNRLLPGECSIFEDVIHYPTDQVAPEMMKYRFYFDQEVYLYIQYAEFTRETAIKMIHYADAQWRYMNIISEFDASCCFNSYISAENLENIASKANLIVVGAYDMEGFVVWEKSVPHKVQNL